MLELSKRRVLITGASGFLGSHLVDVLFSRGCRPLTPSRRDYDLRHAEAVERMFQDALPHVVIHCAAVVGGIGANQASPGQFFFENALMGLLLIDACRRWQVQKTVVIGTVCAYPKHAQVPFAEVDIWSGYPEETNAPYGIAKKALLVQCQAYRQQYGMNAIYLLPANMYGPRDHFDPERSHVIPAMIRKFVEATQSGAHEVVLWGDGSPTREFLYVEDAAEGIMRATEQYDGAAPMNLGTGQEISITALAWKTAALTGFQGQIRWDQTRPNGQPRRCLDISKARQAFSFQAQTSLDAGLQRTIEWYQKQRGPETD